MTEVVIVKCGSCSSRIKVIKSRTPIGSLTQCPSCGKNMMSEGVEIKPYVKGDLCIEEELDRQETLEEDIIGDLRRLLGKWEVDD